MHALRMPYFMTLTEIELSLAPYQKLFMTCLVVNMQSFTLLSLKWTIQHFFVALNS